MTMALLSVLCEISSLDENPSCLLTAGFSSHFAQAFMELEMCMVYEQRATTMRSSLTPLVFRPRI